MGATRRSQRPRCRGRARAHQFWRCRTSCAMIVLFARLARSTWRCSMPRSGSPRHARSAALLAAVVIATGCGSSATPDPVGGPAPSTGTESTSRSAEGPTETASASRQQSTSVTVGETIASGLDVPWGVAFLPDGDALVTQRDSGRILRIDDGQITPLDAGGPDGTVPDVHHRTEDGLLGIAVGPEQGVFLYVTTDSDNRVIRFDLKGDALVNARVILEGIPSASHHDGGRLAFGPDGYLYVTTGDTHEPSTSQNTDNLAGKILRITTSDKPAPGNPYGNEVWSYGHRNVQGIGWTSDGRMSASEYDNDEFDELNLIEPGNNYGWPHVEGWVEESDYTNPLVTWPTSEASPSGIAVTDAGVWVAALRGERLWYVPLTNDGSVGEPRSYLDVGRLRDAVLTPDGDLWVVTSNTDGRGDPSEQDDRILQLKPS